MSVFTMPAYVVTGKYAVKEAMRWIKLYGNNALIVTGKHIGKSPMLHKLISSLKEHNISYSVFDGITGEPTVEMIAAGTQMYQEKGCDFCIGLGGGSPLDAAKAIALQSVSQIRLSDYMGKEIDLPMPPVVAIPTTAGTGSETTKFTVITDPKINVKMLLKGNALLPQVAVIDPEYSIDMPQSVTAATGLDALTHAIEGYTSKLATPLTDTYALAAVKRIMQYLPVAYANGYDLKAREEMALAAFEAGVCINNSSVTLVHGMSRPIGALFHVPHGVSNAMLLKECLGFALAGAVSRFADLAYHCGAAAAGEDEQSAARKFLVQVSELVKVCQIPTLREYGIEEEVFTGRISQMAADAVASGSPANTRKMVSKADCEMLYRKIYGETRQGS